MCWWCRTIQFLTFSNIFFFSPRISKLNRKNLPKIVTFVFIFCVLRITFFFRWTHVGVDAFESGMYTCINLKRNVLFTFHVRREKKTNNVSTTIYYDCNKLREWNAQMLKFHLNVWNVHNRIRCYVWSLHHTNYSLTFNFIVILLLRSKW